MSLTRVLFPLPETPVITLSIWSGKETFIFFKLCSRAPFICKNFLGVILFLGISICARLERYFPVQVSAFNNSLNLPCATTSPPKRPASGPKSIISSDARMISSSCSTTITVFPKLRSPCRTSMSLLVSFGCNPILGSSSIYSEPTKLLPNEVARLIRWDSPPDNVLARRLSVR